MVSTQRAGWKLSVKFLLRKEDDPMKKLSLLLAIIMMFSCFGAFAESGEGPAPTEEPKSAADIADAWGSTPVSAEEQAARDAAEAALYAACEFALIEADGEQPRLTYMPGTTSILEVDGYKFKDLNKNGSLDVYEDWRKTTDERIADLLAQMTVEEEVGLLFCVNTQLYDAAQMVKDFSLTCQLFNLNGTPTEVTTILNNLQAVAEAERLGVPMVYTSDREYNAWGGYIHKAQDAWGNANDPELAYELAAFYGKAMDAVGIHVTFEPFANEIGAQYGENPELIASIIAAEIKGLSENGLSSCTKHWIGRGGDSSFGNARSVAQNFDNWMVGWKAALENGTEWVMTNCGGTGITNTCDVKWDPITMGYLRETLGFDGVVVTDWWGLGGGPNNPGRMTGITPDGIDLGQQTIGWLYNRALELGTDMWGSGQMVKDYSKWESSPSSNYPYAIIDGLASGEVQKANVDKAATRILKYKFDKGLFEDPYNVIEEMLPVVASAEWIANQAVPTNDEELRAGRNPDEVALTEKLMAKSSVLLKNENDLLPLEKGIKVYVEASSSDKKASYKKYIANYATVVENMEEADVMIGDFGSINDVAELFIDDAIWNKKPMVVTLAGTDPDAYVLESADALVYIPYSGNADHGSTEAGFNTGMAGWVYADMLFGVVEPGGIVTKEIARDATNDKLQWKDLAGDQGAPAYVRLIVQALMEDDPQHASPNNYGDPLVHYQYGMAYGAQPEFKYSCLILPEVLTEVAGVDSSGNATVTVTSVQQAKAGQPFTVYALLRNNGADGMTIAQAYANDVLVAEKIMTVDGGSWRVLQMELTLEAGTYTINIGGQTGTVTVVE